MKKAAQKRGERLPGSDKSTKRDSQKESEEPTEMKEGCFMCFALNKPYQIWGHHSPERCFRKEKFEKKLEDPEQRTKLVEKIATKPSSARGTYVKSVYMSSTMSSGILIDPKTFN